PAFSLAENAMRKHLPPQQRVLLTRIEPREALKFRPLGQSAAPPLRNVLGEIVTARDELSLNANRLVSQRGPALRMVVDDADAGLGGWPDFLSVTVRELTDLYVTATENKRRAGEGLRAVVHQRFSQLTAGTGRAGQRLQN